MAKQTPPPHGRAAPTPTCSEQRCGVLHGVGGELSQSELLQLQLQDVVCAHVRERHVACVPDR